MTLEEIEAVWGARAPEPLWPRDVLTIGFIKPHTERLAGQGPGRRIDVTAPTDLRRAIARAPEDIAWLIAEVKRLRPDRRAVHDMHEGLHNPGCRGEEDGCEGCWFR